MIESTTCHMSLCSPVERASKEKESARAALHNTIHDKRITIPDTENQRIFGEWKSGQINFASTTHDPNTKMSKQSNYVFGKKIASMAPQFFASMIHVQRWAWIWLALPLNGPNFEWRHPKNWTCLTQDVWHGLTLEWTTGQRATMCTHLLLRLPYILKSI